MKEKITIDDIIEINKRMGGYFGWDISFTNGFMGEDMTLDLAQKLSSVVNEVCNSKKRSKFVYKKGSSNV